MLDLLIDFSIRVGERFLVGCSFTDSAQVFAREPFVPVGTSKWCPPFIPRVLGDWGRCTSAYALEATDFDIAAKRGKSRRSPNWGMPPLTLVFAMGFTFRK